jgi:hypothetical protein
MATQNAVVDKPQSTERRRADLVQVDQALESWRDSGLDLAAACGEPIDNSIEEGASTVRIHTERGDYEGHKAIVRIVFADNGRGIKEAILPNVLSMGFSSRYNSRQGLGRFGVGLKLAALSVARRVDIYTKAAGSSKYFQSFIDLDLINKKTQTYIEAVEVKGFPEDLAILMNDERGKEFKSGTLVVWSKVDRLSGGGRYGTSLDQKLAELTTFVARAYRKFIDQGTRIELDGKVIDLHDPLFLLDNPRVIKRYRDIRGEVIQTGVIPIDDHEVTWTVSLIPVRFRPKQGSGGDRDDEGKSIEEFHIAENEGKLSILRNGREIYYDLVPKLLPGGMQYGDRYIGIEVTFPAAVDEYFQVRHVKRGAEPVSKLRDQLRGALERPVKVARKRVREHWEEVEKRERAGAPSHEKSTQAVTNVEQTSPKGQAGMNLTEAESNRLILDVVEDVSGDAKAEPATAERIKEQILEKPITIVDGSWPGKELFEITHLNGKAIVKINHRHPFIAAVYEPVQAMASREPSEVSGLEAVELARRVENTLDVVFMAYAKAENMHRDPDLAYGELRSYWGQFAQAYVREVLKDL